MEELKSHNWFKDIDWNNIRQMPAPFLPIGSADMKLLIEELKATDSRSSRYTKYRLFALSLAHSFTYRYQDIIKKITANFDEFNGDISFDSDKSYADEFPQIAAAAGTPPTSNTLPEFYGYTFTRSKAPVRPNVDGFLDELAKSTKIPVVDLATNTANEDTLITPRLNPTDNK